MAAVVEEAGAPAGADRRGRAAYLQENVDALAKRVGQMNAHVIRLDALGQRLTEMANIDDREFDFGNAPAQGGPEPDSRAQAAQIPQLTAMIDELAHAA